MSWCKDIFLKHFWVWEIRYVGNLYKSLDLTFSYSIVVDSITLNILFISKSFAPCYLHLRNMVINTDYNSSCFIADIFKNIMQCIKYIFLCAINSVYEHWSIKKAVIVMVTQNGCFFCIDVFSAVHSTYQTGDMSFWMIFIVKLHKLIICFDVNMKFSLDINKMTSIVIIIKLKHLVKF